MRAARSAPAARSDLGTEGPRNQRSGCPGEGHLAGRAPGLGRQSGPARAPTVRPTPDVGEGRKGGPEGSGRRGWGRGGSD